MQIASKLKELIKRFTLWELLKGMRLTGGYFFKTKTTIQYPEEETPTSPRFRGMLALRRYENGEERCIACKLCEVVCPAAAITIEAGPRAEDGSRRAIKYEIDAFKCIYCGFCEEACPVDAVVATSEMHYTIHERGGQIFTKDKLLMVGDLYEEKIANDRKKDAKYR